MRNETTYYWTDPYTARERLAGSVIPFGDFICEVSDITWAMPEEIEGEDFDDVDWKRYFNGVNRGDLIPNAYIAEFSIVNDEMICENRYVKLDDPRFKSFQEKLPFGWFNSHIHGEACHIERLPIRNRQHGISASNVSARRFDPEERGLWNDRDTAYINYKEQGAIESLLMNNYIPLEEAVQFPVGLALSPLYAISPDPGNTFRELYRGTDICGYIWVKRKTLLLPRTSLHNREEMLEAGIFAGWTIEEI